jgi:dipeptidyl aminopeptidase/acylaminoacyl peptidase
LCNNLQGKPLVSSDFFGLGINYLPLAINHSVPPLSIRITRLAVFSLATLLIALVGIYFVIAWIYIYALTQPPCQTPRPIPAYPHPEEHHLTTEDDLQIRAWYYPSQNGAAILSLGGPGGSLGTRIPPVDILLDEGYGVLQIDSRACAQPPAPVTLGYDETLDAAAGLAFLLSQPEVDPQRIGAYGFSMGGVTTIRVAARHPEISAALPEGGYYNLGDHVLKTPRTIPGLEKLFRFTIALAYRLNTGINPWSSSPIDDIAQISPRPVFLIYGEYEVDNGGGRLQYEAAEEPKELWVVPHGNHGRNHLVAPEEYRRRVLDFFNQALDPD